MISRTFGIDYIYFDLVFLAAWTGLLYYKKYRGPLKWGLAGAIIYLLIDYLLWFRIMGTRHYEGPLPVMLFFLWFCFSPGFVQFSYVIVLFEKRSIREVVSWTLLLYGGWTLVGLLSKWIPLDDRVIRVWRDMGQGHQHTIMLWLVVANLVIAVILYLRKTLQLKKILYFFLTGTLVEFALEFSLAVTGLRLEQGTWSPQMMLINSLVEFNCGIVIMYLLWRYFDAKDK